MLALDPQKSKDDVMKSFLRLSRRSKGFFWAVMVVAAVSLVLALLNWGLTSGPLAAAYSATALLTYILLGALFGSIARDKLRQRRR